MSLYRSIYTGRKGSFERLLFSLLQKYKKIRFVSLSLCLRDPEKSEKSYSHIYFWLKKTKWSTDQSISNCLPHSKNKSVTVWWLSADSVFLIELILNILWEFHRRQIWNFKASRNTRIWSNIRCLFSLCNNLLELNGGIPLGRRVAMVPIVTCFPSALHWVGPAITSRVPILQRMKLRHREVNDLIGQMIGPWMNQEVSNLKISQFQYLLI